LCKAGRKRNDQTFIANLVDSLLLVGMQSLLRETQVKVFFVRGAYLHRAGEVVVLDGESGSLATPSGRAELQTALLRHQASSERHAAIEWSARKHFERELTPDNERHQRLQIYRQVVDLDTKKASM
jgi:hypothetical protein